jgi:hypothetical protein
VNTTVIGVIVILVVGLIILLIAALGDRAARLRAEGSPGGVEDPQFVTASDLNTQTRKPTTLSPDQERDLLAAMDAPDTTVLATVLAADVFATHTGVRTVVDDPVVLICAEPLSNARDLFRVLGRAASAGWNLVVAAPGFTPAVLEELLANFWAGNVFVQPLVGATEQDLSDLAAAVGAPVTASIDLKADDVTDANFGHAARLVASLDATWIMSTAP